MLIKCSKINYLLNVSLIKFNLEEYKKENEDVLKYLQNHLNLDTLDIWIKASELEDANPPPNLTHLILRRNYIKLGTKILQNIKSTYGIKTF